LKKVDHLPDFFLEESLVSRDTVFDMTALTALALSMITLSPVPRSETSNNLEGISGRFSSHGTQIEIDVMLCVGYAQSHLGVDSKLGEQTPPSISALNLLRG